LTRDHNTIHPSPLLHLAVLFAVFAMLALLATRQVGSLDVGFHLRAGEHILAGEGWPDKDPFTYTLGNRAYTDTSWGYQVLIALIQRAAGAAGLTLFHAAIVLGVFFLVYLTARLGPADGTTLPVLILLGALASEMRFEVRPELLSYLFLALTLFVLHRYAERGVARPGNGPADTRILVALPAIQLVWANTHSLFILGWVAMGCFLVGLWIRNRSLDSRLLGWSAGALAVTLLNPYGWRGVIFPFTLATRMQEENVFAQSIGEFVSPFALRLSEQFPFYPRAPLFAFRVMVILAILALIGLVRQKRYWCLLLWLPFFALSVRMIRNIPLMVIVFVPIVAWGLPAPSLLRNGARLLRKKLDGRRMKAALTVLLASAGALAILTGLRVATDAYYISSRRMARTGLGWNRLTLPIDAARFAVEKGMSGARVLNHLNFGGWLMWALDEPVFIDGRLEVAGEEFYGSYRRIFSDDEAMDRAVERYGIRWLIFPYATNSRLLMRISDNPGWQLAYVDHLAVIFVRNRRDTLSWVDPGLSRIFRISLQGPATETLPGLGSGSPPGALSQWVAGLWSLQVFPSEDHNLGLFHYIRSEISQAAGRFSRAVAASGGAYYETYLNLGSALYHQGRFTSSREAYRVVLDHDPGNRIATERLAQIETFAGP
jgi:hypothetical protein